MKYAFGQVVGDKVIGLQIFLAPKQAITDLISVKPEEWDSYVKDVKEIADEKAKALGAPVRVDVQINHASDGVQEMEFDDLKTILFGTAE